MKRGTYPHADERKSDNLAITRVVAQQSIGFLASLASIRSRITVSKFLTCKHGLSSPPFPIFVPMRGPYIASFRPILGSRWSKLLFFYRFLRLLGMRDSDCADS